MINIVTVIMGTEGTSAPHLTAGLILPSLFDGGELLGVPSDLLSIVTGRNPEVQALPLDA